MSSKKRWYQLSIVVLLLGAVWIWYSRDTTQAASKGGKAIPRTGFYAPDFSLQTLQGDTITLSDLRGQAVVINLWASWCPPCKAEMPALQRVHEDFSTSGLVILAVNATNQDDLKAAERFVGENGLTFPILLDINGEVSRAYQLRSLPTTFFVDPDGMIQEVVVGGPMAEALLRVRVERLLGDMPQ